MRPVLANLLWIVFLLLRMFGSGEAVKFIQLDIFGRDLSDDFLISGLSLGASAFNPTLHSRRMNAFDASDGLRTETFESLLKRAGLSPPVS
jgi:hypothetical protein